MSAVIGAVPVEQLNISRLRAQRVRAEWLASVHAGLVTPIELVEFAATGDGAPLRKLRLRDVLMSQPDWGQQRANAVLTRLRHLLDLDETTPARITVAWLLDNRTRGQRFDEFLYAVERDLTSPWPGFPTGAEVRPS